MMWSVALSTFAILVSFTDGQTPVPPVPAPAPASPPKEERWDAFACAPDKLCSAVADPGCTKDQLMTFGIQMNTTTGLKHVDFCPPVDTFAAVEIKQLELIPNTTQYLDLYFGGGANDPRINPVNTGFAGVPFAKYYPLERCTRYVQMHVLRTSLFKGLMGIEMISGIPYLKGTGFDLTCKNSRCILDPNGQCLLLEGKKDGYCSSKCFADKDTPATFNLTVYLPYYGKDNKNSILLSGAKNPTNFVSWSGTQLYETMINHIPD